MPEQRLSWPVFLLLLMKYFENAQLRSLYGTQIFLINMTSNDPSPCTNNVEHIIDMEENKWMWVKEVG